MVKNELKNLFKMAKKKSSTIDKTKTKRKSGSYARKKGNSYELKIIKELNLLYDTDTLVSSRSESKRLDDAGIDIVDGNNIMPFYVQCKNTQNIPSVDLIKECKRQDKPLAIFWNKQIKKEVNCISAGEFVIVTKELFYKLLRDYQK